MEDHDNFFDTKQTKDNDDEDFFASGIIEAKPKASGYGQDDDDTLAFDEDAFDGEEDNVRMAKEEMNNLTFCILRCKLCAGVLNEPVSLPCGHNFCRQCLNAQMANTMDDQHCSCRVCRASFVEYTKKNGIKSFKENYLMSGLIGLLDQIDMNNDSLFDLVSGSYVDIPENKDAVVTKNFFNKLISHTLVDRDMVIIEGQIKKLQHARRIALLRTEALRLQMEKTMSQHVDKQNFPKYVKAALINDQLVEDAKKRFALPKDVYNLIVIQTEPDDFKDADRFFKNIISLPIRGMAAERSIVIIECISQYLDVIINEVFDAFQITYEGIIATWVEDDEADKNIAKTEGSSSVKKRSKPQGAAYTRQTNINKTHFFVSGIIGQVRAMREKNRGNDVLEIRAPVMASTILPYKLFESLAKLLSVYQNRCLILTGESHMGSSKEISLPLGWDLAKQNI